MSPLAQRDRSRLGAWLTFTAASLLGCSSLAPEAKPVECQSDDECDRAGGEVCANDQGNVCLAATLPDLKLLGLDVRSDPISLRVDVRGTDAAVERITTRPRYRISLKNRGSDPLYPGVRDNFTLDFREIAYFASEAANKTIWEPLPANISLRQESRIGQGPHLISGSFPVSDDEEAVPDMPFEIAWPHYTAADIDGNKPIILELRSSELSPQEFGIIHRILRRDQIAEAADHSITVDTTRECVRDLTGEITVLSKANEPQENLDELALTVTLRYGEGVTSPTTIQPPPAKIGCSNDNNCPEPSRCIEPDDDAKFCGCESDEDCPSEQICYLPQNRCALDLAGRDAFKRGDIKTSDGKADLEATIYSHCEGEIELARELPLVATVDPTSPESGLPRLSFALNLSLSAADIDGDSPPTPLGGRLCLPHWRPAIPVSIELKGSPANLHTNGIGTFSCCGTECLSETTPGSKPAQCTPTATISASGIFELPEAPEPGEPSQWENAGCLPLYVAGEDQPRQARFNRAGIACTADSCDLLLSPGGYNEGAPFPYELRIEPPVGSIFRSVVLPTEIATDTASLPTITLPHRVLLRGQVELAEDLCTITEDMKTDCTFSAQVMAERIRLPEEADTVVLGPHFYASATFGEGDFVLPLNPGVYLLTALPQIGSPGGPATIQVVDLREGSDLVKLRNGIPYADLGDVDLDEHPELVHPLVLATGQLVTIELDSFSSNSTVIPLDMASWSDLVFEGMTLDLSAASTCYRYTTGDPPSCQIRRLRPGNTTLRPSQEKFVKFITRQWTPDAASNPP